MRMLSLVAMLSVAQLSYGLDPLLYMHLRVSPSIKIENLEQCSKDMWEKSKNLQKERKHINKWHDIIGKSTWNVLEKEGIRYLTSVENNKITKINIKDLHTIEKNEITLPYDILDCKIHPDGGILGKAALMVCTKSLVRVFHAFEDIERNMGCTTICSSAEEVGFDPTGKKIAFLTKDETIEIWNFETGNKEKTYLGILENVDNKGSFKIDDNWTIEVM